MFLNNDLFGWPKQFFTTEIIELNNKLIIEYRIAFKFAKPFTVKWFILSQ